MQSPAWIIQKKRDGKALSATEIREFIAGVSNGSVADYQATAFLMAVFFQGMNIDETIALTQAMLESGERYHLSHISGPKSDKHSTGGVGDKVSLILAPLAAACGLKVPMMSGRGLGHSGGTLDKLESIEGFEVKLSSTQFQKVLSKVGCAMIGQSERMVPADRKLYSLRDVTATVECIPLIVASILSKKIAEGTDSLVLDVKVGNGAFMKTRAEGRKLAKTLVQVAKKMGLPARALLTDMSQPLGYSVGNAIELRESIEILRGERVGPELHSGDLRELTLQLCAHMLELAGVSRNLVAARKLAQTKLQDGSAYQVFTALVEAQGGDPAKLDSIPLAPKKLIFRAKKRGFISSMDTEAIGRLLILLGGGRKKASDPIDHGVGMVFYKKLGSKVAMGEPLGEILMAESVDEAKQNEIETKIQQCIEMSGTRKAGPKLILEQVS
jgi:pyrimidine-nucleoside phosphorylase